MHANRLDRIGLVVHPRRELGVALATVREWAERDGAELVQLDAPGQEQQVAARGEAAGCDVIVALGGDGTALAALRLGAPVGVPVLGVACGSLGALTAVTAGDFSDALSRVARDDWEQRRLPALAIERDGERTTAINDLVLIRAGAGQVIAEVAVDGERFIRFAGDGLVVGTPLGSTAYTLAAGGPMLAPGASGMVMTPLAPHGGVCPPLVAGPDSRLEIQFDPGNGGARIELDGQIHAELEPRSPTTLTLALEEGTAVLVSLGEHEPLIAGLRRRRIILDSARVLARDERERDGAPQRDGDRAPERGGAPERPPDPAQRTR